MHLVNSSSNPVFEVGYNDEDFKKGKNCCNFNFYIFGNKYKSQKLFLCIMHPVFAIGGPKRTIFTFLYVGNRIGAVRKHTEI